MAGPAEHHAAVFGNGLWCWAYVRGAGQIESKAARVAQVVRPIPVRPRVTVMLAASIKPGIVRIGDLVVADDMSAVERHAPPRADGCDEPRARVVFGGRERRVVIGVALVLDAARARVVVPVAAVPRDV